MYASNIVVAIVICGLAQASLGDVAPTERPTFSDLLEQTKLSASNLYTTFASVVGLPQNELYNDMANVTKQLQTRIEKVIKDLSSQSNLNGNLSTLVETAKEKLAQALSQLKEKTPDTNALQEKFHNAVDTLVEQGSKVAKDLNEGNGEVQAKVKGIFEQAVSQANTFTTEFGARVNKFIEENKSKDKTN